MLVDPDLSDRQELRRRPWSVPAAIAAGGVLGAEARYGVATAFPAGDFPWSTLLINVTGCLLIGVLMVLVVEAGRGHPLTRPFLGVGVLGGYTTFSGYEVDAQRLLAGGHVVTAVAALLATPVLALVTVTVAARTTRRLVRR